MDCYEILGISADTTLKDINSAYKKLALKHHPDKTGGGDTSQEFQKIQEAVEILRDPTRRSKHDEELRRRKSPRSRSHYEDQSLHTFPATGWRPANPFWWNLRKPRERYMYSYRNSVHMDPHSPESKEEIERCRSETYLQHGWDEIREWAQNSRQERFERVAAENAMHRKIHEEGAPAREAERAENSDPSQTPFERRADASGSSGAVDDEAAPTRPEDGDIRDSAEEDENDQSVGEYATAASWNPSLDLGSGLEVGEGDCESTGDGAPVAADVPSTSPSYGTDHNEEEEDEEDEEAEEAEEEGEESGASIYYDFSESESGQISASDDEDDDDSEKTGPGDVSEDEDDGEAVTARSNQNGNDERQEDVYSYLAPFIPFFVSKLSHGRRHYTHDDLEGELRGMVMETYCGWLEDVRLTIPGSISRNPGQSMECRHLGFWQKQFGVEECEVCQLWMPIYTLQCPGCGAKACVRCKFQSRE